MRARAAGATLFATWCAMLAGPVEAQDHLTVTFFIASDCPISNAYAPEMSRICTTYKAKGVSCTLTYEDLHITTPEVQKHVADYNLRSIPATLDPARTAADRFHVEITPTAILVDARGEVRYQGQIDNLYINIGRTRQQVTSHYLTDALDAVLAGRPVRHPKTDPLGCYVERP